MRAELSEVSESLPARSGASGSKRWLDIDYLAFGWVLLLCDFSMVVALSVLSGIVYHGSAFGITGDINAYVGAGFVVGGFFVACQKASGLYEPTSFIARGQGHARTIAIWVFVFTFFSTAAFLLKITTNFSRGTMVLWFAAGLVLIPTIREIAGRFFSRALATGALQGRRILGIFDPEEAKDPELVKLIRRNGYHLTQAVVAPAGAGPLGEVVEDVRRAVRDQGISEILVCASWRDKERIDALTSALRILPVPVRLIPDRDLRPLLSHSLMRFGSMLGVEVQRAPLTKVEQVEKRAFDIICALAGLLVLVPLLAVVAIAIKLDSRGPVLFRQHRTGFNGRAFSIFKFRTMTTQENGPEVRQATRNDSRITQVGRILRATSLDELPQLLNVLAGHMSLVGPRPHAVAHDDYYSQLIADYAMRQHMKPGITGWAQVSGLRGETAEVDMMRKRVEHDLWYISNWSFLLDLRIILRTCFQVWNSDKAY